MSNRNHSLRFITGTSLHAAVLLLWIALSACSAARDAVWKPRCILTQSPHPRKHIDWSRENIYFLLIDRFHNGDPGNDAGNHPASYVPYDPQQKNHEALKTYQGGDLQGVIDRLDYLHGLGVTTLWLSPVFDNSDSSFMGWWPYHGYHPIDFYSVDEHFGDMALLKRLVQEAHGRGMKVLLDMIYNHVAPDHPWVTDMRLWEDAGYKHWFHPHSGSDGSTSIQDWGDQEQLEKRELNGLPDLDQANPEVYAFLFDVSKYWITETNCDGFRLDAVKHISPDFWRRICADLHAFAGEDFLLLGEVFAGETDYVARYENLGFNALFDIPLYYTINRVFAQGGVMPLLSEQTAQNRAAYKNVLLSQVIDNHDVARFSHWAGTDAGEKMRMALAYAFSQPGIPMLYYGNEVALEGAAAAHEQTGSGQDYLNRLPMPWERVAGADADLVDYTRRIVQLRHAHAALRSTNLAEVYQDYGVYAYVKYTAEEALLLVFSNSSVAESRAIPLPRGVFAAPSSWRELLDGGLHRSENDTLHLALAPYEVMILSPQDHWRPHKLIAMPWRCDFTPRISADMKWITFSYSGQAQSVVVAGDFNGWSAATHPLTRSPYGVWEVSLPLKKGRYRYKLVLDGSRWLPDPGAAESELDPYGDQNSVISVE